MGPEEKLNTTFVRPARFYLGLQSWTLVTMAFDRLIAICFPLRYHSIVTKQTIGVMLMFSWVVITGALTCLVKLIDRLSFCGSLVVKGFFCDHPSVYRLACNDNSMNNIVAYICFLALAFIPLILIALTYVCISVALNRITSGEERLRAFKTCSYHLILVAIFFLPVLCNNIISLSSYIHPNVRIINASLTLKIPALLNPIVYALKTEEVLNSTKKLIKRKKINKATKK
ncbi:olfactory receptor 51M1-like [Notolabrus celidotus]|uniref:olfactory receptor 51M1-like n=1 Tax=Notolabrus celidotus TaxID=1203425 RepID=UPI00148FBD34|nr:olfactory receptor 51M1-like [Notolabrus celidotus]